MPMRGVGIFPITGVSLLSAAGTTFTVVPIHSSATALGIRFIPLFCHAALRTMSGGALSTAPAIKIGANASHNDVAPTFTLPMGVSAGVIGLLPLATPLQTPQIADTEIVLEMVTAGVGPSAMIADLVLTGLMVGV